MAFFVMEKGMRLIFLVVFFWLTFIDSITVCAAQDAQLSKNNLFTLHRMNYKPEKTLYYDLVYDKGLCKIYKTAPLDVYYLEKNSDNNKVERVEMSSASQEYFAPQILKQDMNGTILEFTFKSLEEATILEKQDRKVIVQIIKDNANNCRIENKVRLEGELYALKHIEIKAKVFLGIITGVDYVWAKLVDSKNVETKECLHGECPNL